MKSITHEVFISYSSKNKKTADAICHTLEQNKIKCWIAPRDLAGGVKYGDVIEKAIKNCKVFVIVFSEHSSISQWVESELNIAFSDNLTIVPFKIDKSELSGEMRLILNNRHWIDAYPNPEIKFKDLVEAVKNATGKPYNINDNVGIKWRKDFQREAASQDWKHLLNKIKKTDFSMKLKWSLILGLLFIFILVFGTILLKEQRNNLKTENTEQTVETNQNSDSKLNPSRTRSDKKEIQNDTFTFIDDRNKNKYKAVKIGNQIWMAENLNYSPPAGKSWIYDDSLPNAKIYGKLYNFETAKNVCPKGWHLPSMDEWRELKLYAKYHGYKNYNEGNALKSVTGWKHFEFESLYGEVTNEYGFSGLPGGYRDLNGQFIDSGKKGYWWCSSGVANNFILYYNQPGATLSLYDEADAFSVRCVMDSE